MRIFAGVPWRGGVKRQWGIVSVRRPVKKTAMTRRASLTTSDYSNNCARWTLTPLRRRLFVVIIRCRRSIGPRRRRVCRSVVEADHTEVVRGASRRRRPVVRVDAASDAVRQRNPLPDRAVLDDVIVGWAIRSRHRPRDVETVSERSHGHVERRRRLVQIGYGACILMAINSSRLRFPKTSFTLPITTF